MHELILCDRKDCRMCQVVSLTCKVIKPWRREGYVIPASKNGCGPSLEQLVELKDCYWIEVGYHISQEMAMIA